VGEGRPSPEEYKHSSQWAHESTDTVSVSAVVPALGSPVSSVMQMKTWHQKKKKTPEKKNVARIR